MTRTHALTLCCGIALLGGCGRIGALDRKPGMAELPVPVGATRAATPAELIAPDTQARPARFLDLLGRSERRGDDYFAIPPGARNGRPGGNVPDAPAAAPAKPPVCDETCEARSSPAMADKPQD